MDWVDEPKRVGLDIVNGREVSTVRLYESYWDGDHESLVDGGDEYRVWGREAAVEQHAALVKALRDGTYDRTTFSQ